VQDFLVRIFPLLIPLAAVSIPLVVVIGKFLVQPIVQALSKMTEAQESLGRGVADAQRIARLEDRLESIERSLRPLMEEREFQRQLHRPPPAPDVVRSE
jgi:hypothetical protein